MAAEQTTALATIEPDDAALALSPISDAAGARARLRQLQVFVQSVMVDGHDFGKIPGTDKPTLYKPGAEKLLEMYGLAATYDVTQRIEEWERGFWHYEVRCRITSRRNGLVVGEGVGSCNSMETRYRWRTEWGGPEQQQAPQGDGWRLVYVKKQGRKVWQRRVENEDRWDLPNTILKMAKKRGLVDGTLSVTRSSGMFTQDLEDLARREEDADVPTPAETSSGKAPSISPAEYAADIPDARACPSCDQPMVLRSGVTRDGRPYSAWFCSAKCGQKPIWLAERKGEGPPPTRRETVPAQPRIVDAAATPAADRLLSAKEVTALRAEITETFRRQSWTDEAMRDAVATYMREAGVEGVEKLTLHGAEAMRRWARELSAGGVPPEASAVAATEGDGLPF